MAMNRRPKAKRSSGGSNSEGSGLANKRSRAKAIDLAASKRRHDNDEHIDSSDDDDNDDDTERNGTDRGRRNGTNDRTGDSSSEEENLDVKKVRLAREYLAGIDTAPGTDDNDDDNDDDDNDDDDNDTSYDAVSRQLQRERLVRHGALKRDCADDVTASLHHMQEQCRRLHSSSSRAASGTVSTAATTTTTMSPGGVDDWIQAGHVTFLPKGHDLTPTCVAVTGDGRYAVSGSKDHSVVLWDMERQTPISTLCAHWKKALSAATTGVPSHSNTNKPTPTKNHKQYRTAGQVLSVACSDDGKYVAVGKRDATVSIYDVRAAMAVAAVTTATTSTNTTPTTTAPRHTTPLLHQFTGHKNAVTGLAFRTQSHQLFTASEDRCIRHYSLDEMLYMETLYGHQFGITDIDCYLNEQPVSVGRDRTARAWKLAADSHLIFRGGAKVPSADTVTCIQEDWFLTGHDNGVVSLWSTNKKRAVASVEQAHGRSGDVTMMNPLEGIASSAADATGVGRGIVSIASIKGSDVAATGSHDGYLRFWKVRTGRQDRGLDRMGEIPIPGFINDICFSNINASSEKLFCVAAIGQEHRLGRWERVAGAKNRIAIIQLQHQSETTTEKEPNDEE